MPPSEPGVRARRRADIQHRILQIGGEHLARFGAAALSLRAVARDLGMVSSAVYRYVASRDELLTLLIVQAYDEMADEVETALAAVAEADPGQRFRAICRAARSWARANPHKYALIYGSPVPDYQAPAEQTVQAGTRVLSRLIAVVAELPGADLTTAADLESLGAAAAELGLPAGLARRGLTAWTLVLGAISAEVFEQFGAETITAPDGYFESVCDEALRILNPG